MKIHVTDKGGNIAVEKKKVEQELRIEQGEQHLRQHHHRHRHHQHKQPQQDDAIVESSTVTRASWVSDALWGEFIQKVSLN